MTYQSLRLEQRVSVSERTVYWGAFYYIWDSSVIWFQSEHFLHPEPAHEIRVSLQLRIIRK